MSRKINLFGKQVEVSKLLFSIILFAIFFVYIFIEKSFVKARYLESDINDFGDNYSLKIYLTIWAILIIVTFIKTRKTKEEIGRLILLPLFYFFFGYIFLTNFITINALCLNQIKSVGKEKIDYIVFNHDNLISLSEKNHEEYISDEKFINKIIEMRERNHLKPLKEIKHGDTISIVYDKGLFGFKYLN